jgi:ABC-type antimicrobial peptide transport system permease subunit
LAVAAAIQTQARQSDPRALVTGIAMLDEVVNKEVAPWRFSAWVLALFAGLAFTLAMLGLFSLVSLDVANRRREFAIRMAVGASDKDIVAGVIRSTGRRAMAGLAIGVTAALVASRSIGALLFDVDPIDAPTYISVIAVVIAVTTIAAYVPARRAASAQPLDLLRRD